MSRIRPSGQLERISDSRRVMQGCDRLTTSPKSLWAGNGLGSDREWAHTTPQASRNQLYFCPIWTSRISTLMSFSSHHLNLAPSAALRSLGFGPLRVAHASACAVNVITSRDGLSHRSRSGIELAERIFRLGAWQFLACPHTQIHLEESILDDRLFRYPSGYSANRARL
jgi:hypothetical protein